MELKNLPANTCPLCRQAALDQSTAQWTCDFCGCKIDFDPDSRRSRIVYWPAQYAALKDGVGSEWLSRRELFERVDLVAATTPPARQPKLVGPLLVIASALLLLCVMLGAVASALVVSPSIARTRRVISQAYLPTARATITPTAETALPTPAAVTQQPALDSPVITPPALDSEAVLTASLPLTVEVTQTPLPTPELPTPALPQAAAPQPTQPLPPTFTPVPPTPTLTPPPVATPTVAPAVVNPQASPLAQPTSGQPPLVPPTAPRQ